MVYNFKLQITTLVLGVISLACTIAIIATPSWRVSSEDESASSVSYITFQEGLWVRCTTVGKGSTSRDTYRQCDNYENTLIGVTSYLPLFRVFMIIALIACFAGVIFSILGMNCTGLVKSRSDRQRRFIMLGGICHITAGRAFHVNRKYCVEVNIFLGVLIITTVSWYAAEASKQQYSVYYQSSQVKYKFGGCIYVGWIAGIIELGCGFTMLFCTCYNNPADDEYHNGYITKDSEPLSHRTEYSESRTVEYNPPSTYRSSHSHGDDRSYHDENRPPSSHHSSRTRSSRHRDYYDRDDRNSDRYSSRREY